MFTIGSGDYVEILDYLRDVQTKCFNIGTMLKLPPRIIDDIQKQKLDFARSMSKIIECWLIKKNYDVKRFGEPCLKMLVEAVENPGGGDHKALAIQIASKRNSPK